MRGRTPAQAVQAYVQALQRAVSCVTAEVLRASGYDPAGAPHSLLLGRGAATRLTGPIPVALHVRPRRADWRVILEQTRTAVQETWGWL